MKLPAPPPARPKPRTFTIVAGVALALVTAALVATLFLPGPLATVRATGLVGSEQADAAARRVMAAFDNVQAVWQRQFRAHDVPEVRLHSGVATSPCLDGQAASGPYYCP